MSRWAIVDGHYWWNADHHEGKSSRAYARLSRISGYYRPSPLAHGPADEEAQEVYRALCAKAACEHE